MSSQDIRKNPKNQGPKLAWSKPRIEEVPVDDYYRELYRQALEDEPDMAPDPAYTVYVQGINIGASIITQNMIDGERETAARCEAAGDMESAQALYDSANRMELARAGAVKSLHPNKSIFGRLNTTGRDDRRVVTDLTTLNREYALMQCPGLASAWVCGQMPITDVDMKRRLNDHVVLSVAPGGKEIRTPAFKFFAEHAGKKIYRRIDFTSKKVKPDCLNLYRGLGVTPKPGKCDHILNHIKDVICCGANDRYEAMLNLMAWQLQNIGKPSRVIVVLHNPNQQAGKGILLETVMLRIYGPSGTAPSDTSQITGRFNDILRGISYIFCDEILFSGDRKTADAFKRLATTEHMPLEGKGLPIFQYPVAVNLWLASNHENAVHVEEGDARYWILKISEHRIGDATYFAALIKEIETEGTEAFAHYLLTRDVSSFVPKRDVPRDNTERRDMILGSINPLDSRRYLEDCATCERILGMHCRDQYGKVTATSTHGS
jgi:Family of unknown function (DUF5906)